MKDQSQLQKNLLENLGDDSSLGAIQKYIKKVIEIRGFGNQSVEAAMLLLLEETGELAKAIRKSSNMTIDSKKLQNYDTVESEVADVFIVLTSVCNILNIDLFQALKDKEIENTDRTWS